MRAYLLYGVVFGAPIAGDVTGVLPFNWTVGVLAFAMFAYILIRDLRGAPVPQAGGEAVEAVTRSPPAAPAGARRH
jgi:hypothetical protein